MLQTYDERNADIVYWVDGVLRHRDEPGISPFDSAERVRRASSSTSVRTVDRASR